MSAEKREEAGQVPRQETGPLSGAAALLANRHEPAERLRALFRAWRFGLGGVWHRKLLWLTLTVFTPGWLISVYSWAALPLARPWQLAVVAAAGLMLIALPAAALWLVFRGLDWRALITAPGYTTVVLWALLGLWLPWQLVWWVIPFESARAEGVLAAIRFVAADALFTAGLLWLGRVLARSGR
jgi:hypothetical protein